MQSKTAVCFNEYADYYIKVREAKSEVAPSAIKKQRDQFRAVKHHVGHLAFPSITAQTLDNMYIAMLKGETLSDRPSGGSYVNQIHDNIELVFEAAIKDGLLIKNPCDDVVPPKMDTKPKKALSRDLTGILISKLDPAKLDECAYLPAITLGLRRGETCGLSWEDIDFQQHLVNIRHAVDTLGNLKGTKTKAGMRILPLPDITWKALQTQMVAQALQFAKTNSYRKPEEGYLEQTAGTPVIATHFGQRVQPGSLSRWWKSDAAKLGIENFTLHKLRHTYLTLLAQSGVHPKVMQELAGHYSCQITMDIYTHVNMAAKQQAVSAVSNIFPEDSTTGSLPAVGMPFSRTKEDAPSPLEVFLVGKPADPLIAS